MNCKLKVKVAWRGGGAGKLRSGNWKFGMVKVACWERGPRGRTKVCSTERRKACMLETIMKQPDPVVIKGACRSEEADTGVRHGGVCEGDGGAALIGVREDHSPWGRPIENGGSLPLQRWF